MGGQLNQQAARTEDHTPFLSFLRISGEGKVSTDVDPLPALKRAGVESAPICFPWSAVFIPSSWDNPRLLGLACCIPIAFFFLQTAQNELIRRLVADATVDGSTHIEELRGNREESFWTWLGLAMQLQELSSFIDVEDCDRGHPTCLELLTEVGLDPDFFKNFAKKIVNLFFRYLVMKVANNDLHDDRRRSEGKRQERMLLKETNKSIASYGSDPIDVGGRRGGMRQNEKQGGGGFVLNWSLG